MRLAVETSVAMVAHAASARMLFGALHAFAILAAVRFARAKFQCRFGACRPRKAVGTLA